MIENQTGLRGMECAPPESLVEWTYEKNWAEFLERVVDFWVGFRLRGGGELRAQRIDPGVDVSPPQTEVSVQTLKAEASEWGDFRSRVFSFRFERTAPMDFDLPVFFSFKGGTATPGVDFRELPWSIVIPAGQASAELLVEAVNDSAVEGDEWAVLTVEPPACVLIFPPPRECYRAGERSVAKALIRDDDGVSEISVVSIEATLPETRELCAEGVPCTKELVLPGVFTVARTGSTAEELEVFLVYSGTASPGVDYEELRKSVVFGRGQKSVELRVLGLGDYWREENETVVATLTEAAVAVDTTRKDGGAYRIDPQKSSAKIVIRDRPAPLPTSIRITDPAAGTIIAQGHAMVLRAIAVDTRGGITRLEFYSGDQKIGESEIFFIQPPEPGQPILHEVVWKDAPAGDHVLTARGVDATGAAVVSEKVRVQVRSGFLEMPVVSLRVLESETSELAPWIRVKPAVVELSRTGATSEALRVWMEFSGTATYGKDYEALSQWVAFPAGSNTVQLVIFGTDDDLEARRWY